MASINNSITFHYGTSGYRGEALILSRVVERTAYFAATRAKQLKKTLGLMITASHNPPMDNGVKVIDYNGQMLDKDCEPALDALVNRDQVEYTNEGGNRGAFLLVGTDTRDSSPHLLECAKIGAAAAGVQYRTFPLHTTPMLHFFVSVKNLHNNIYDLVIHTKLAISEFLELHESRFSSLNDVVYLDCANGVGALWMDEYLNGIPQINVELVNTNTKNKMLLNYNCGADYVKIAQKFPDNFKVSSGRCASLDGDADRLIYFYANSLRNVRLMDGDHIAALYGKFIVEQINAFGKEHFTPTFGVVQTAYSNGNSAKFFSTQMNRKPIIVKTGVKNLEEAAKLFDIGLYFEANGHGTVLFSDKFNEFVSENRQIEPIESKKALQSLHIMSKVLNQLVGDGIANFIMVELILRYYQWSIEDWEKNTYTNLPTKQLKVPVQDRYLYVSDGQDETKLIEPILLQESIDSIIKEYPNSRAFVRPSGTESIVRVFAEAPTQETADELASKIANLIHNEKFI